MKYFILLTALITLGACSEGDRGLRFSDNYIEQQKREKAAQTASGCAFDDIDYQSTADKYSTSTETLITELLSKYVTGLEPIDSFDLSGQVNYKSWVASSDDKKKLCAIVNHFNNTDASGFEGDEKKAFYINAYNILTIELILKNYSNLELGDDRDREKFPDARSIKNINNLGDKVWETFKWKVGSAALTLDHIEKKILIPMNDARIHFAINCASKGCPPLRNEAFSVTKLDAQLDEMSNFFVSSSAYSDFELFDDYDPESGDEYFYQVSRIFRDDWYAQDFKNDKTYGSVRAFLVRHLQITDEDLGFPKADLENEELWVEEYDTYDWSLNEVGE